VSPKRKYLNALPVGTTRLKASAVLRAPHCRLPVARLPPWLLLREGHQPSVCKLAESPALRSLFAFPPRSHR